MSLVEAENHAFALHIHIEIYTPLPWQPKVEQSHISQESRAFKLTCAIIIINIAQVKFSYHTGQLRNSKQVNNEATTVTEKQ